MTKFLFYALILKRLNMYLYFAIIIIASIFTAILGVLIGVNFLGATDGEVLLVILLSLLCLLIIDAVVALIIHKLPKKLMNPYKKIYKVFLWEKKFYHALGIRKWKDKIPETGKALTGFGKSKVENMDDTDYLYTFMIETVYAEVLHFWSAIFGFLIVFISPKLFVVVGLPLALANVILQIMPVMVQRYNRPKLMLAYERAKKNKQNQSTEKSSQTEKEGLKIKTEKELKIEISKNNDKNN